MENEEQSLEQHVGRAGPPPLRIHHLLAWMTVTAVLISVTLWFDRTARNGPPIKNPFAIASLIFGAIAIAGALTCTGFGASWRRSGYGFPAEPGQWWLVTITAAVFGVLVWIFGSFAMLFLNDDWIEPFQMLWAIVYGLALFGFYLFIILRRCDTNAWQLAIASTVSIPALTGPFIVWAVVDDRRRKITRHWSHWMGAIIVFLLWAALMSSLIAFE
jgi:hypothetical protein